MKTDLAGGQTLTEMFASGTVWLEKSAPDINAINVFPLPDGDTGTNMVLTMQFALEKAKLNSDNHISSVAKSLARGALMGARGNSGVEMAGIVTIYYGAEIKGAEVQEIAQEICDRYHTEVEVVYGGQPHYNYIISLE